VFCLLQNALFETGGILPIRLGSRCLQLWNLAAIAVLFDELLDPSPTDLELLGDQPGVHVMINNPLTYPGDILPVKLHFRWSIVGEIMPTTSLADTTADANNHMSYQSVTSGRQSLTHQTGSVDPND